ncbi:hypothetical protein [Gordonia humi]|uniref:Membrane protein implicated in regulation of membrane protease activity n=1 Tax=Gordonia humi TaxID=686429 RepID=A0A840EYW9_9ACTN|nr:hypothetical protein [Gordonia humi]MBB4136832.1 membrane protein implicated in regulation of membrane protease activity [Gordonia humi]
MGEKKRSASADFSFGRLVAYALGAATGVIVVAAIVILFVAQVSATAALIVALVAVVAIVGVIALVSRRMMAGVQAEIDERRAAAAAREEETGTERNG